MSEKNANTRDEYRTSPEEDLGKKSIKKVKSTTIQPVQRLRREYCK